MLSTLAVTNIALIEKLELELGAGLNILSGETGAGKSIIIDSLNFVLGERADKSLIRYGTDFATVEAVFSDYATAEIESYLEDIGLEPEEILILRRKMSLDGKNECRINGKPVTLSLLKGLTELLVDIHGQHEHQSLLKVANHLSLLDGIGSAGIASQAERVRSAHGRYVMLKREYARFGDEAERERRLDILGFQISEIEKADVKEGEEEELLDRRRRIRNQEKILGALNSAKNTLDGYDSASVTAALKTASGLLSGVGSFDDRIGDLTERLDAAKTEVADISDTLDDLLNELDFDAKSAEKTEERLETVRNILRKFGGSYESLTRFYDEARAEADTLANAGERAARLEKEIAEAAERLTKEAAALTVLRVETARDFEARMMNELNDLGMGGSTFSVRIDTTKNVDEIGAHGADAAEFLISPNVGEPLKPLAKIISGGEMSRFMLALKNIVAELDGIGTMVFDEIDTGISGRISAVVAEKLCNISRKRQVIAVTHMPGLAAMADNHYLIEKSVVNGKTLTSLTLLEDDTAEIARLIGGSDYSAHAEPHAREMKARAAEYKAALKNPIVER